MRVHINPIRCSGYGLCATVCPQVYKLDEWGYAYVEQEEIDSPDVIAVRRAAAVCPENAITISDS